MHYSKRVISGFVGMWSVYLSSNLFFSVFFIKWSLHSVHTYVLPVLVSIGFDLALSVHSEIKGVIWSHHTQRPAPKMIT
jgi:hypothetical protein